MKNKKIFSQINDVIIAIEDINLRIKNKGKLIGKLRSSIDLIKNIKENSPSKDYVFLFHKIKKGHIAPCFLDYSFSDGNNIFRDIAKIERRKENDIVISARGIQYGGVDDFSLRGRAEIEYFIDECNRLNLEYYI